MLHIRIPKVIWINTLLPIYDATCALRSYADLEMIIFLQGFLVFLNRNSISKTHRISYLIPQNWVESNFF